MARSLQCNQVVRMQRGAESLSGDMVSRAGKNDHSVRRRQRVGRKESRLACGCPRGHLPDNAVTPGVLRLAELIRRCKLSQNSGLVPNRGWGDL
jgi:hypothetical protein